MQSTSSVFATLEPSNLQAKLDFDYLAARLSKQEQDGKAANRRYIHVNAEQEYNPEIYRLRLRRSYPVSEDLDPISATSTEVDTDGDNDLQPSGMIWTGYYPLDLTNPPTDREVGWVAGKGDPENEVEILLGLNDKHNDVRGRHIILNFHHKDTGFLSILSRASITGKYQVTVNGKDVIRGSTHSLNQNPMIVRLGTLEYIFSYTDLIKGETFSYQRKRYLNTTAPVFDLLPTPKGQARTFGAWTICNSLGKGSFGKVHSATDYKGRIAAIKVVDRTKSHKEVRNEIQVLQELARTQDDGGHLLRLIEVIYPNSYGTGAPFEEVAIILQPCVQGTFEQLTKARSGSQKYVNLSWFYIHILIIARLFTNTIDWHLFIDALRGVRFLHSQGWAHRDLKPQNIGWRDSRAVILDMGGAVRLLPNQYVRSEPGTKGTIPYLAPELEMGNYDRRIDTWSMGVILFELVYGHHPWKFFQNPWRPGHEHLRNIFHREYNKSIEKIRRETDPKLIQGKSVPARTLH
jgi:hypothetical protein